MADSRRVRIIVDADVLNALRGLREVEGGLGRVGQQGRQTTEVTSSFGQKLAAGLANVGVATGFDAIKAGFGAVVSKGLDYERNMNTLQAVTGATAAQMKQVGDKAKQLGNDITIPGASASDAAEAMRELAKGGLTVDQSMAAATGTLRLATAAQVSGAEAAEIQANALNSFGLSADKADHVADLLANSANAASGEVTDMAAALQQSATVAKGFGISIDDTTTTLALFARNGIQGSDAGTSFKTMLTQLASPTEKQSAALADLNLTVYDAQGKFVGMRAITEQLATAKGKLTTAEYNAAASTAFGTDAIRAANILGQEGIKGWKDMATAVEKTGGAQELAAAQSQGLSGALDRFQNSVDATALSLYEKLQPAMSGIVEFGTSMVGWIADGVEQFSGLAGPVKAAALALGGVVLLRGPLLGAAANAATFGRSIVTAMTGAAAGSAVATTGVAGFIVSLRAAQGAAATFGVVAKGAMSVLGGPIGLAIIGVTTALGFMTGGSEDAAVATADFSAAIDENTGKLSDNANAIISKAAADSGSFDAYEKIGGSVKDYTAALMGSYGAQDRVHTALQQSMVDALNGSAAFDEYVSSGGTAYRTVDEMATALLAGTDVNIAHTDSIDAAITASQHFAADTDNLTTKQRQARQALEGTAAAAASSATGIDGYDGAINGAVGALAGMDEKLFGVEAALGGAGGAAKNAAEDTDPYAEALKAAKDAATEADTAVQFLTMSLQLAAGKNITAEQATRANEASMRDMAAAARDATDAHEKAADAQTHATDVANHLGTTMDGQAVSATNLAVTQRDVDKASRDAADAADAASAADDKVKDSQDKAAESAIGMAGATKNSTEKTRGMDAAIQAATEVLKVQRTKFIESQSAADQASGAAARLADAQGLIPENVKTTYSNPGVGQAISDAATFLGNLQMFNGKTYTANINANYNSKVGTAISGAASDLFNFADGGMITGPGGPREDNHIVAVSSGEYIINAASTAKYRDQIEAINLDKFADGGMIGRPKNHRGPANQGNGKFAGAVSNPGQSITGGFLDNVFAAMTEDINAFQKAVISAFSGGDGRYPEGTRGKFMQAVASKMGTEYVWGAAGPDVFDCSGLMSWALAQAGASVGRLTAEGFNSGFPHIPQPNPGSMVTFDTGRLPGQAGHIGMVLDPAAGTMMHTDGAGPARTSDYRNRGGLLGYIDPIGGKVSYSANQQGGDPPASLVDAIRGASASAISSIFGSSGGGGGGGGVEQWRSTAIAALQAAGQPVGYVNSLLKQMNQESSGRPAIQELTDRNFRAGHPSTGLMQVIQPTFEDALSRHGFGAYIPKGLTDPFSNILASILYTVDAYGDLGYWARNGYGAYAKGGIVPGGNTPGDDKVWAKASPGEAFLTNNQWATAKAAVQQAGRGGVGNVTVNARVFVGDREITDIVRVETDTVMGELASTINRGRLQTV